MKTKIIRWLKKQVKDAGAKGIVLGLSGGVDSSVAAALAKKAVGKDRLLGLIMPIHSHTQDAQDALVAAREMGLKTKRVDLSKAYDALIKLLPGASSLARANLKPRLRMAALYYFANDLDYLVCGTGNKSELSVGYFTKYGDGGCDILPLGDLLKRQVRALARELKVPEKIIVKPPTAGLWPGQTDEGEMGLMYFELDDILDRMGHGRKQTASPRKVEKVKGMMQKSAHKKALPAICVI